MNQAANELAEFVQTGAREVFLSRGSHAPQILFLKGGKLGLMLIAEFANDGDKDKVAAVLHMLQKDSDAVAFVAEAWLGKRTNPMPRDDPERQEALLISLTDRDGNKAVWRALITRKPLLLGPWAQADSVQSGRFV